MRERSPEAHRLAAVDIAACRTLLRGGSRTFYAASFLLPRDVREPASALYGFCRLADDAVDHGDDGAAGLDIVRGRLERAYEGRPLPLPMDRAFADVVHRFAIPRTLPEALLEGFEWDLAGRRYDDLAALNAYAARVAGSVGAMMAMVMGVRAPEVTARACDLGVAMQLSNIARDVGEDARMGRLYLPRSWLAEAGIDVDAWLARPVHTEALGTVIRRLLHVAEAMYERVDAGIEQLPPACRPGIRAARMLYAEIGHEVRRRGFDAVSRRAVVSGTRKATLLARALAARANAARRSPAAALEETRFLIDAVAATAPPAAPEWRPVAEAVFPLRVSDRVVWLVNLFERLERRDAMQRSGAGT